MEQLWALSLPSQDHDVGIEMPVSSSRFHYNFGLHSDRRTARSACLGRSRTDARAPGPTHRELLPVGERASREVQLRRPTRPHAVAKRSRLRHRRHAC